MEVLGYVSGNSDSENWFLDLRVIVKNNVRLIVLDGMIELIEQEFPGKQSVKEMFREFGQPRNIVNHTSGHFYVYKDKGFSVKEVKGNVCSYTWYEKAF